MYGSGDPWYNIHTCSGRDNLGMRGRENPCITDTYIGLERSPVIIMMWKLTEQNIGQETINISEAFYAISNFDKLTKLKEDTC